MCASGGRRADQIWPPVCVTISVKKCTNSRFRCAPPSADPPVLPPPPPTRMSDSKPQPPPAPAARRPPRPPSRDRFELGTACPPRVVLYAPRGRIQAQRGHTNSPRFRGLGRPSRAGIRANFAVRMGRQWGRRFESHGRAAWIRALRQRQRETVGRVGDGWQTPVATRTLRRAAAGAWSNCPGGVLRYPPRRSSRPRPADQTRPQRDLGREGCDLAPQPGSRRCRFKLQVEISGGSTRPATLVARHGRAALTAGVPAGVPGGPGPTRAARV